MSGLGLWAAVAGLGGAGSLLRFLVDERVRFGRVAAFPLGILVVNVSAALLIGVIAGAALPRDATLLLAGGFVGAYSTFSTWMLDTVNAASRRWLVLAATNVGLSVALGVGAAWLGQRIGAAL